MRVVSLFKRLFLFLTVLIAIVIFCPDKADKTPHEIPHKTEKLKFKELLSLCRRYSTYHIADTLLMAICYVESNANPNAKSHKNCCGLFQIYPPTFSRFGKGSIWDIDNNAACAVRYLEYLHSLFEVDTLVLAGYNAGENAVIRYGYRVPPYGETKKYVKRVKKKASEINKVIQCYGY